MNKIEWLLLKLFRHVDIEKPDKKTGEKTVYLRRFFIFETKPLKLYLHIIKRSDDDPDPHDHPWNFSTLILANGYNDVEYYLDPYARVKVKRRKIDKLGFLSFRRRPAEHIHKVVLRGGKPAWTLAFIGRHRRNWGFATQDGWKMWREYLNYWGPDPYDDPDLQ